MTPVSVLYPVDIDLVFYHSGTFCACGSASQACFLYLLEGTLLLHRPQDEPLELSEAGTLVFLSSTEPWSVQAEAGGAKAVVMRFTEAEAVELCPKERGRRKSAAKAVLEVRDKGVIRRHRLIESYFEGVQKLLDNKVDCPLIRTIKLRELLLLLGRALRAEHYDELFCGRLTAGQLRFRDKVMQQAEQVRSVNELIAKVGMSRAHFNRAFASVFAMTPYKWVLKRRGERVREVLTSSNEPIKVLVERLGFSSQANLNKFCCKYLGMTAGGIRGKGKERKEQKKGEKKGGQERQNGDKQNKN